MAVCVVFKCNKCNFSTEIFYRWRKESMIEGEGPAALFCVKCKKIVPVFIEEPIPSKFMKFIASLFPDNLGLFWKKSKACCPDCGGEELIGINVDKCPMCSDGMIDEDEEGKVWY